MPKLSIRDVDLEGKRVFVRVDFNVPLSDKGSITDDTRIRQTVRTIEYALGRGARLILASHLGRPKGKLNPKMSLAPVAVRLGALLNQPVAFAGDCVGLTAEQAAARLQNGEVLLLENLRFHSEEEANDPKFSRATGEIGRCLRQRRIRSSPPCPCLNGRHDPFLLSGRGWISDGEGIGLPHAGHVEPSSARS